MTRLQLLQLAVARARSNGFELRRWYTGRLGLPWISSDASIRLLDTQRRYYALLFAHEFASSFWKTGTDITFEIPATRFERQMPDGSRRTVTRKPFIRRSARRDVWRYHLRQMALAEEPLRYLRKYLHIEEQLDAEPNLPELAKVLEAGEEQPSKPRKQTAKKAASKKSAARKAPAKKTPAKKPRARALPAETPAFLKRPYPGRPG